MDQPLDSAGDIDVNDLFNEENLNNAALGADILSESAILQGNVFVSAPAQTDYLGDLTSNGSGHKLTWGKPGVIAQIVEHGAGVQTQLQRLDPKSSCWSSTKPEPLAAAFETVVGLAWSPTGTELAVVDSQGRINVFNMYPTAANRFANTRDGHTDPGGELNQPVGLFWLNFSRSEKDKKKTVLENTKENGRWKHEHIEGGSYPPHALRALCTINRSGIFTLLFTRDGSPYKSATLSLPVSTPPPLYTHVALSQTPEGQILIALHGFDGKICAYSVDISFTPNEALPMLVAEIIAQQVPATPPYFSLENSGIADLTDTFALTHFFILQESEYSWAHLDKTHLGSKQPAALFAAYSSYNSHKDAGANSPFGASIIKKWQFQKSQSELHSRFGSGSIELSKMVLQSMQDTPVNATITNMQIIEPGSVMAITTLDGSTAFWDPDTMAPITAHANFQTVSSIGNVDLDFPPLMMSPMQSISPHAMVLANTDSQDKLIFTNPRHRDPSNTSSGPRELDIAHEKDDALVANFILCFSRSCWQNSNFDDVLSTVHATVSGSSLHHIRRQLFLTLFQPKTLVPGPQTVSEVDKVPHSMIVYKALAFNLGLFKLDDPKLDCHERIAHLWAWTVLNLRWSIAIIGDTYKSLHTPQQPPQPNGQRPSQPSQQPILPATFLDLVCHNIRWVFALYSFIFSSMLGVSDRRTHPEFFDPPSFSVLLGDEHGNGQQGLIALLLNCNWSRSFLLMMARLMKACATKAGVNINFNKPKSVASSVDGKLAGTTFGRVAATIHSCCLQYGLTVNALELLFDQRFHPDTWKSAAGNAAMLNAQVEMMVTGYVSEEYQATVSNMVDNCINGTEGLRAKGEIDRLRLSEECPGWSELFLNMDDVAFKAHRVAISAEKASSIEDLLVAEVETNSGIRKKGRKTSKPLRVLYDVHKKLPLFSLQSVAINPPGPGQQNGGAKLLPKITSLDDLLGSHVRRCVRCGSVSDALVEGLHKSWPRQILHLMNRCVCDGSWIVETVGEGLDTD